MYRKAVFSFVNNDSSNPISIEGTVDLCGPYLSMDYISDGGATKHIEGHFHWLLNLLGLAMQEFNSNEARTIKIDGPCSWTVSYFDENLKLCTSYSGGSISFENIDIKPVLYLYEFASKVVAEPEYIQE